MSTIALFDTAVTALTTALATPSGIVALCSATLAGMLVIVSSFVKTMIPLRCLAIGGNLGFLIYGALHPSLIMVMLHGALLPINIVRAAQMVRLTRRVQLAAASNDLSGVWLRPYMRRRRLRKDAVLFRKGDAAKRLYFLAEGQIEFVEIGQTMEPGRLFGEIGFFAPDKRRTLTARCATPCTVLQMDEMTFKTLYFQNPAFGFEVVTLLAGRLFADRQRLEERLAAVTPVA
ncbi:cyclic nucleotide-binding domain-containing protein [Variovorax soli]|uniref:Phosphotransferase system glucose/maltose/N-acetylglucosamine-specific IIC component n=1 Tax=Variovorax soli TaxID=376815 RepID=A0ABU1NKK8_9BURK|nr:cyclic nucleotide-binding domain-containing protein [Variovorax soli]MDR6538994.1 phosphotransferase system glucose/maltose/N-acetylglucosamine-specific IIC component [Variovorax soli]